MLAFALIAALCGHPVEVDVQQFAGTDTPDAQQAGGLADIGIARSGEGLVLIQALSGEEVALVGADAAQAELFGFAKQMSNFQYLVGDRHSGECAVIDGAWDPEGLRALAEGGASPPCRMVTRFIATHAHWDHIGRAAGRGGPPVPGIGAWLGWNATIHVPRLELADAAAQCAVSATDLVPIDDGDEIALGTITLKFFSTPGHSKGSMVLLVIDGAGVQRGLITGDTVFPGSCGRIDLPGSDPMQMFHSLQNVVAGFDDDLTVYPGHGYSGRTSTIGQERVHGLLRPMSAAEWKANMM